MPTITVFTPTYNRKDTLQRLYRSLCAQTVFDFEWLIVDDGSTDGTEAAAGSFSSAQFPVRYIKKENGGKHTAYNLALQQATGTYFLCVDSDAFSCRMQWKRCGKLRLLNAAYAHISLRQTEKA